MNYLNSYNLNNIILLLKGVKNRKITKNEIIKIYGENFYNENINFIIKRLHISIIYKTSFVDIFSKGNDLKYWIDQNEKLINIMSPQNDHQKDCMEHILFNLMV